MEKGTKRRSEIREGRSIVLDTEGVKRSIECKQEITIIENQEEVSGDRVL